MSDTEPLRPDVAERPLRWLNLAVGLVQMGAAAVMMWLVDWDKVAPVYTNFPDVDAPRAIANMRPVQHRWTTFSVGAMSSVFLFMSGLDHWLVSIPSRVWRVYFSGVKRGRNLFRWTEYFFSASLMHAEIALLCGIFDVHLLFAVYALTAVTMVFGALQEVYGSKGDATLFYLGMVPHLSN
mgnify:CR=1 FL=1